MVTMDQQRNGTVVLRGALQFDTVTALVDSLNFDQWPDRRVLIDLSAVESVDSAGLALCLEWVSRAQSRAIVIAFRGVPEKLRRLAELNHVADLFAEPEVA